MDEHGDVRFGDLFPDLAPSLEDAARARLKARTPARHRHSLVDDVANNERYTKPETVEWALDKAKVRRSSLIIDLAACPESHHAKIWHGNQPDGTFRDSLGSSWRPSEFGYLGSLEDRFTWGWLNPPYDRLLDFCERLMLALVDRELGGVLFLPPGDRNEQPWWHKFIEPYREGRGLLAGCIEVSTHNHPGRCVFGKPGDPKGFTGGSAPFPSVLVIFERTP